VPLPDAREIVPLVPENKILRSGQQKRNHFKAKEADALLHTNTVGQDGTQRVPALGKVRQRRNGVAGKLGER